jgi:multimeric flavodoxin WrbA
MTRILALNGSYRDNGAIDQAVALAVHTAEAAGATVEVVELRDYPIEFCRNCRECTQTPGAAPGLCVQQDRMHELIDKIEAADAYILASPTNFFSVTAIFKRFMERLVVYAFWPWGTPAPQPRKRRPSKKAILIATSAAPGLMGRVFYTTLKQLKLTAKTIGAKPSGSLFIGLMSQKERPVLAHRSKRRIQQIVDKLMS